MLCGLIFRGVAFEIRAKARRTQNLWDLAFVMGSATAAFCQGMILGTLLQGIKIVDGRFAGDAFDWLSPFSVFCGLGLLVTYATLGCGWLVMKTDGDLQRRMRVLLKPSSVILLAIIGIISLWTVLGQPAVAQRWFGGHNFVYFAPVPLLVLACVVGIFRSADSGHEARAFILMEAIIFLGYSGLLISIFPNIVPPSLSIWAASAPRSSQIFLLVGVVIIAANHSFLHGAVLLGVPRQSAPRRRGLSLMKDVPERSSLRSRLGWFAMLYVGGVLAAFMLAAVLHMLLRARL